MCLITSRGNSCSEYGPKRGGRVLTSRQTPPKGRDGDAVVECLPGPRACIAGGRSGSTRLGFFCPSGRPHSGCVCGGEMGSYGCFLCDLTKILFLFSGCYLGGGEEKRTERE